MRFMAQFDAMYARDWPAERLITLESQINPEGFQVFTDLIREGIADGSLRRDLDPDLTMHAVINAVIGAQRRLASLGNKVEKEYGKPIDRLFRETIRVMLLGLRCPGNCLCAAAKDAEERQGPHQKEVLMKLPYLRPMLFTALLACFVPVSLSAANTTRSGRNSRPTPGGSSSWRPQRRRDPFVCGCVLALSGSAARLEHREQARQGQSERRGRRFFPRGYRLVSQNIPCSRRLERRVVSIEFDGVYRDATVYLNGHKLGTHPYGYTAFTFDLTPEIEIFRRERAGGACGQLGATKQPLVQRIGYLQARSHPRD